MRTQLRWKILLFTVLPLVILATGTLFMVNRSVTERLDRGMREDLLRAGAVLEQILGSRAEDLRVAGQVLVKDPRFFSVLTIPSADRGEEFRTTVAGVASDFNAITRADVFEVLDERGQSIATAGGEPTCGPLPPRLVADARNGRATTVVLSRRGVPLEVALVPAVVGGRVAGMLLLGSRVGQLQADAMRRLSRADVSFVSGARLSGSTLPGAPERVALERYLASSPALRTVTDVPLGRGHYLTLVRPLPGAGPGEAAAYVLQRSMSAEMAFLRSIQRQLFQLGILAVLAALAAGMYISRRITRPLRQLVRGAEEMERGNYDFPLDVRCHDEVGYLAARFGEMRENLKEYVVRLEEMSRAKSDFLSVASHDLRTPITIIKGFQELLAAKILGPLTGPQQEAVEAIGKSSLTLTRIAEDATRMAQIDTAQLQLDLAPERLGALLQSAVDEARASAPARRVRLDYLASDELPEARVDGPRLRQAVVNLVQNGIRFTPDGGRVEVCALVSDGRAVVRVSDTGIGIPQERQMEVFDRPFAVRDVMRHHSSGSLEFNSRGLGLGLSIARGIVEAHGGSIALESMEGRGTTMTVSLPLEPELELETAA